MKVRSACLGLAFLLAAGGAPAGEKLRIGIMPAVNSIPLIVAEHLGGFAQEGVEVELVMFQSQLYRETALQTGQIDGTISDLVNAIGAWANGFDLRVTSLTDGVFALLTAPGSPLRSLEDWKSLPGSRPAGRGRVPTGLLANSIVYYVTEQMLEQAGVDPATVELVSTLYIPNRLEMLLAGQVEAACLPEPVATVAEMRGAHRVADTLRLESTPGILLFTGQAVREKAAAVQALHRAYNRAVEALNREGDRFRQVIVTRGEFPPQVRDALRLPRFRRAAAPTPGEVADVAGWMAEKGLITRTPAYRDIVAPGLLP